jgi:hypothetical protein
MFSLGRVPEMARIMCLRQVWDRSPADSCESLQHLWNAKTWEIHAIILKFLFICLHAVTSIPVTAMCQIIWAHKCIEHASNKVYAPADSLSFQIAVPWGCEQSYHTLSSQSSQTSTLENALRVPSWEVQENMQYTVQYLSLTSVDCSKILRQDRR